MPQINPGDRQFVNLAAGKVLSVVCGATGSAVVRAYPMAAGTESTGQTSVGVGGSMSFGPFEVPTRWAVEASGQGVEYMEAVAAPPSVLSVPVSLDRATGALVGAAGVIAYPASAGDALRQSASVAPVASAISTTVAVAVAIPAQSTKVRIAWQGRGSAGAAAGTARLNIACNRENLTAGLVASQDVRRRDYQLAAGEAVVLQSATPITVLHCSANESVSANTHGIQVSYE